MNCNIFEFIHDVSQRNTFQFHQLKTDEALSFSSWSPVNLLYFTLFIDDIWAEHGLQAGPWWSWDARLCLSVSSSGGFYNWSEGPMYPDYMFYLLLHLLVTVNRAHSRSTFSGFFAPPFLLSRTINFSLKNTNRSLLVDLWPKNTVVGSSGIIPGHVAILASILWLNMVSKTMVTKENKLPCCHVNLRISWKKIKKCYWGSTEFCSVAPQTYFMSLCDFNILHWVYLSSSCFIWF